MTPNPTRDRLHTILIRIDSICKEIAPQIKELTELREEAVRLNSQLNDAQSTVQK